MDSSYFGGEAIWDIDIFTGVNRCLEDGFKEEDIIVDTLMTSGANLKDVNASDYKTIGMIFRYKEVASFYNTMDGLLRAKFAYSKANFRYVVTPTDSMPFSWNPINLNEKQVDDAFNLGFKDAQAVINKGEAAAFDDLIHYHALKKRGDPRMNEYSLGTFLTAKENGLFEDYSPLEDPLMAKYQI
mmetsp:Transcript_11162/g.16941  ORF Transcript_11162/g.16941 Transcript_11162/m.16941 type:complete len:185 (+) Transcript_11162:560-1114(+)